MQHRVLQRQLKRLGIDPECPPNATVWQRFLERVNLAYETADQDRYLLERSLSISSREMQALYRKLLEASEKQYRMISESATDGIVNVDEENTILYANPAAEKIFGYTSQGMVGQSLSLLLPDAISAQFDALFRRYLETGIRQHNWSSVPFTGLHREGHRLLLEASFGEIIKDGRRLFTAIIRDITERMRAEKVLRESERRFRDLFESSPDAIFVEDFEGTVLDVNPAACQLHGLAYEQLIGLHVRTLVPLDQRENAKHIFESMVAGNLDRVEVESLTSQGARVPVEISLSHITHDRQPALLLQVRDITERKRAEEQIQQLNEDLQRRAHALETANEELESFSYSVSHDLRAPLRAIDGFAEILADDYAEALPQQAQVYLQTIQQNAHEMDRLIEDLLTFSRLGRQALDKHPVDVEALTHEVFEGLLRHEDAQRHAEAAVGALPECQADPALLKQVWVNLLSNALKFTRGREAARIEVGSMQQNGEVVYFVKDNGVGFDMAYADKLFQVFQRLHLPEEYEGTGVGLALVQRIVRRHGGRVWAEAALDEGATFYFTLGRA